MQTTINQLLHHLESIQDEVRMQNWGVMGMVSPIANYSINQQSVTIKDRFNLISNNLKDLISTHPELEQDSTITSFIKNEVYQDYMCQRRKAVQTKVHALMELLKKM